jgi:hypothetical protein
VDAVTPLHDPDTLASAFRVDWLTDASVNEREDVERAVAEKARVILLAARHVAVMLEGEGTEVEVHVWLPTGVNPAFASVHYEPRLRKHYFLVMDAAGRERLAAIVFERVPSVTGEEVLAETRLFFENFKNILDGHEEMEMNHFLDKLQDAYSRDETDARVTRHGEAGKR